MWGIRWRSQRLQGLFHEQPEGWSQPWRRRGCCGARGGRRSCVSGWGVPLRQPRGDVTVGGGTCNLGFREQGWAGDVNLGHLSVKNYRVGEVTKGLSVVREEKKSEDRAWKEWQYVPVCGGQSRLSTVSLKQAGTRLIDLRCMLPDSSLVRSGVARDP